tara:strand:+ start:379 stop:525 length:147 start_codon:yes stop_codon:yes gene_type:complete
MQVGDLVKYRDRWLETIGIVTSMSRFLVEVHWSTGKVTVEVSKELVVV